MRDMRILVIAQAICILTCAVSSSNSNYSPLRKEAYEGGEIHDITHSFTLNTPAGTYPNGIGKFLTLLRSMKNGSDYNFSELKLPLHAGTHVDAPGHFYDNYFDQGFDVDTLDLRVLNGRIHAFNSL